MMTTWDKREAEIIIWMNERKPNDDEGIDQAQ
jgi:hypothetical protein